MAKLKKSLSLDPEKEKGGVWFEGAYEDVDLKIARINNPKFKKVFERITKPYRRQIRRDMLANEKAEQLYCQALSQTILLDWRNVVEGDSEVEYSAAKGYEYMTEIPLFREIVTELAEDVEAFRQEEMEESEGN